MRPARALLPLLIAVAACTPANDAAPSSPDPPLAPADTALADDRHAPETLIFDATEIAVAAFEHTLGGDHLVIVTNASGEAHGVRIEPERTGPYELLGSTTNEPYRVQTDATGIILEIGARTTLVLRHSPSD